MHKFRLLSIAAAMLMTTGAAQAQTQANGPINPAPNWAAANAKMIADVTSLYAIAAFSGSALLNAYYLNTGEYIPKYTVANLTGALPNLAGTLCGGLVPIVFNRAGLPAALAGVPDGRAGYALVTFRGISQFAAAGACSGLVRDHMYHQTNGPAYVAKNELDNCSNRKIRAGSGRTLLQEQQVDDSIVGYDWWARQMGENAFRAHWYFRDVVKQSEFLSKCDKPFPDDPWQKPNYAWCMSNLRHGHTKISVAVNWSRGAYNNSVYQAKMHNQRAKDALVQASMHLDNLKKRNLTCRAQHEEL